MMFSASTSSWSLSSWSSLIWTIAEYASMGYAVFGLLFGMMVTYWILTRRWSNSLRAFPTDSAPKTRKTSSKYKNSTELREELITQLRRVRDPIRSRNNNSAAEGKDRGLWKSLIFPEALPEHLYFPEEYTAPRPLPRKVRAFLKVDREGKKQGGFLKPRTPVSPHVNSHYPLTRLEALRLIVFAVFVGPARLMLALNGCFFAWVCMRIATMGLDKSKCRDFADFNNIPTNQDEKPRPRLAETGWRRKCTNLMRPFARLWAANAYAVAFVRQFGRQCNYKEAGIITSNHISVIEPPILVTQNILSPVSKEEALKIPLIGGIMQELDTVSLSRTNAESRRQTKNEIIFRANDNPIPGYVWPQILIFPEGTTSSQDTLLTFKPGAFNAGAPVQPLYTRLPNSNIDLSLGNSGPQSAEIVFRGLLQLYNSIEFHWLPPYSPSAEERKDPELFAENVRRKLASYGRMVLCNSSYTDTRLGIHCTKNKVSPQFSYIEAEDFTQAGFSVSMDAFQNYLDDFINAMKQGSQKQDCAGYLTKPQFVRMFASENYVEMDKLHNDRISNEADLRTVRAVALGRLFEYFSVNLSSCVPMQQFPPLPAAEAAETLRAKRTLIERIGAASWYSEHRREDQASSVPSIVTFREYVLCQLVLQGRKTPELALRTLLTALSAHNIFDRQDESFDDFLELLDIQVERAEIPKEREYRKGSNVSSNSPGRDSAGDVPINIPLKVLKECLAHGIKPRQTDARLEQQQISSIDLLNRIGSNVTEVSAEVLMREVVAAEMVEAFLSLFGFPPAST